MKLEQGAAASFFAGLDEDGWLFFPNRFECGRCGYGVTFSSSALVNASAYRWNGARVSKLKGYSRGIFDEVERRFSGEDPERFFLDFHCPQCRLATGIGFERYEFHMAAYRYRPLAVWTVDREEKVMPQESEMGVRVQCAICGRALGDVDDPLSVDCGGDCLRCMADCGDPDCIAAIDALKSAGRV
ncbi:hypothetical protein LJR034_008709 [Caballeronia sp. LjRoot34]|uniref:hypothetical protein n=1 Tax=Caballeronia sp. LjRoot34 TaxID=3342325 RepID=UPI003ECE2AFF